MAKVARTLFRWQEVEALGDLRRLELVLSVLPDEGLMKALEASRGRGRDDYPVRAIWNSLIAGVVFGHGSIESLRRELRRNGQLRDLCGFDAVRGEEAVPPAWVYTRFLKRLMEEEEAIQRLFDDLVGKVAEALPGFGERMAIDGKAIETHARSRENGGMPEEADGRRDVDANWGTKSYEVKGPDGTLWKKVTHWFGYKLHLIVDAIYELPVAFEVTQASEAEQPVGRKLLETLAQAQPTVVERCESLAGDKGYDDGRLIAQCWEKYGIKAVISIRHLWKGEEALRPGSGFSNVFYTEEGEVYCCCPKTARQTQMAYGGFEKDRGTHKYRCPARHYGMQCPGMARCPVKTAIRIPLEEDRRVFPPLARTHRAWARVYRTRTSVERVNSRLDVSYGFEHHFIRGWKKMWLRCGLAFIVMLAMALGRVKEKQRENLRSLVHAA